MTTITMNTMRAGYHGVLTALRSIGEEVESRGLVHYEIVGAKLRVEDPYRPWAENCGRGLNKAIGWVEGLQLISGEAFPRLMTEVSQNFSRYQDGEVFHGAYGPRVRDQIPAVIDRLVKDPGTRQAVITVWDPAYDLQSRRDLPCTITMQFLIRQGGLEMVTFMRSNDAWLGLPYDVFQFTLLQKTIANCLKIPAGWYHHMVGSLHLYESNFDQSRKVYRPADLIHDTEYVGGLDIEHNDASLNYSALDRWEIVRAAAANALSDLRVGREGGETLRAGVDCLNTAVNG